MAEHDDRWRLYGLALAEAWRRLRYRVVRTLNALFGLRGTVPERLVMAPQDLRTADPTVAGDIYAGYFALAGRVVSIKGSSPFEIPPPSRAWAEMLHGFGWLRHLRAADSALARANARALVDDFLRHGLARRGIAAEPRVVARRLISFLSQSPLVLDGADHAFYRRFMRALGRSVLQLQQAVAGGLRGEDRLMAGIALAYAGLCLNGPGRVLRQANRLLTEELTRQILPDGGHISRNPRVLVELLTDLLPLRQTYAARGAEPPAALLGAIDRMMPMLRLFRHGEGSLALFNGMGLTSPDLIATLLVYDDVRAQAIEHAPHSGYERLVGADAVLVADVGAPPPVEFSREAHAGCLSFEFTVGSCRMIVNCGAPRPGDGRSAMAARSTAAHSTVTVGDVSSCHFAGAGDERSLNARLGRWAGTPILSGPGTVTARRSAERGGLTLVATHNGYRDRFNLAHERHWWLSGAGDRIEGEDVFLAEGGPIAPQTEAALRFHLHPSVTASRLQDSDTVLLILPNEDAWSFEVEGGLLTLEESVFFASPDGTRRTEQIVVSVEASTINRVRWRFVRLGTKGNG